MFLQTITLIKLVATCSIWQEIKMGTCKSKALMADLGIFTNILAYLGIFRYVQT